MKNNGSDEVIFFSNVQASSCNNKVEGREWTRNEEVVGGGESRGDGVMWQWYKKGMSISANMRLLLLELSRSMLYVPTKWNENINSIMIFDEISMKILKYRKIVEKEKMPMVKMKIKATWQVITVNKE